MMRLGQRGWLKAALLAVGLLGAGVGCANRTDGYGGRGQSAYPGTPPPRSVLAEPSAYDEIYVQQVIEQPGENGVVGYETLSDGTTTHVVTYVHTYAEPIETYPSVWWSGRWYYNINGDFVYYSDELGMWVYYWGPPAPLVSYWNGFYPYSPYYWGTGYYGAGWYWGGVGVYGYHAYGLPVVDVHHHHHHDYDPQGGVGRPGGGGGSRPNPGKPTDSPNPGGSTNDGPHRTKVAGADPGRDDGPRRDKPSQAAPAGDPTREPTRTPVADVGTGGRGDAGASPSDPTRTPIADAGTGGRGDAGAGRTEPARKLPGGNLTYEPAGTRPGNDGAPTRTKADAGSPLQAKPDREPVPTRRNEYTTAGGQRITVVDPPSRPARTPTRTVAFETQPDTTFRAPPRNPTRAPTWGQPVARPSREAAAGPSRTAFEPSRATPTRTSATPTSGAPSRTAAPSRATPSRASTPNWGSSPSRSMPSRTSPSPSRSMPSRTSPSPSRSMPSRTMPSPSRSMPSRSMPSPARHAPSRSR